MDDPIETNRRHWDELVGIHLKAPFYDVASFRTGRSTLLSLERRELGEVRGKTLLHLQCHFGMDTLSWAREGAIVTGVDFSSEAIRVARELARDLGIDARFVESDVYRLQSALTGEFDVVFASYGVLCWLPDLAPWAQIAASYLRPGGVFYLVDFHPLADALADDSTADSLRLESPYLAGDALPSEQDGSYADPDAKIANKLTYAFAHGIGEVVTALADAGLEIDFLHEFPLCAWQRLPSMQQGDDGFWRLPGEPPFPFLFSIRARKPR